MKKTIAVSITGGLSWPGKMPCPSYSIPATACNVGGKLRGVPGSTCSACYACKGNYRFNSVQKALGKRLDSLHHPDWVKAMTTLIGDQPHFRWHDSGDLQGVEHLHRIAQVCRETPETRHWLPTREKGVLAKYARAYGELPENLVVRLSAAMVDGDAPGHTHTSTVYATREPIGFRCPAPDQGNVCGVCRACWDRSIPNVSYSKH